ncbi:MAG: ankyrin repeat domain-containing protein [Candidatus Margulisbacteria bacterium]|nr:ankyrin repeat domain-containing protein [Candidatus Margulisiibacteriota bacterium]
MHKIIAENIDIPISAFLEHKLSLLKQGKNIFLSSDREQLIEEMLCLKQNKANLVDLFGIINNLKPDNTGPDQQRKLNAEKSIKSCLNNLNETNKEKVLQILARDLEILGFTYGYQAAKGPGYLGSDLLKAAQAGELDKFISLLEQGADVNYNFQFNDFTIFNMSCFWAMPSFALEMLKVPDADINSKAKGSYTPLMGAAFNLMVDVVKELLKRPELEINTKDSFGKTALIEAIRLGEFGQQIKYEAENQNLKINPGDTGMAMQLIFAAKTDSADIDLFFKSIFADKKQATAENIYKLKAIILRHYKKCIEIVRELLKHPDIDIEIKDGHMKTALDYAKNYNCEEIMQLLEQFSRSTR